MNARLSRRAALGLSSLALASCGKSEPYFGKPIPPERQTLIYGISSEPSSLDPATSSGASEYWVMPALFEALLSWDSQTRGPIAALATHYEISAGLTEFTFFLRGHPNPKRTKLPGTGGPPQAAFWSDGRPVTVDDFVHAWRRIADPASGGTNAALLYPVLNGKEIAEGKVRPETLGVRAVDRFTLCMSLKAPAPHFLKVASTYALAAVPRHAALSGKLPWTVAGRMPSCGPFLLHEWRPYDRIVVRKKPRYYDAGRVQFDEIVFLPISHGGTIVNLYKTGNAHCMHGRAVPPLWIPALRGRKDFHSTPAYRNLFYAFNTTKPPFDNAPARYALHMATNKDEIVRFLGGGQTPARTVVPQSGGYKGIGTFAVEAGGQIWDVLSFDPEAARDMLKMAGARGLAFDLTFPSRTRSKELAQILQRQWDAHLGCKVNLVMLEESVWDQTILSLNYSGIIESGWGADYDDPNSFFDCFTGRTDGSGWSDPEFNRSIERANAEGENATRMRKLAGCEERLMRAMPALPLLFDSYSYLEKPYVRGMTRNMLDLPQFKAAWIDTNWRPS